MVQLPALNTPQFTWSRAKMPHAPQPVPPIFQPEVAAEAIVWAADHPRRELMVGWPTVKAIFGNAVAPGLADRYLARDRLRGPADRRARSTASAPGNLFEPVPGDQGAHGPFDAGRSPLASALGVAASPPARARRRTRARRGPSTPSQEAVMSQLVADYILARLREWGVHRIYGYPGDGINALLGAFDRAGGDPELIQVRHEEMAAFMACAHAKFTGEVGVCLATSGPGAIHLLNGLYDAKLDHAPVVAIVGQQARAALGGDYQQEVDLVTLFKDVAGEYVQMATVPGQIRHLVDRAFRIALAERTVTCLIVPNDLAARRRSTSRRTRTARSTRPPATRRRASCPPTPTSDARPRS